MGKRGRRPTKKRPSAKEVMMRQVASLPHNRHARKAAQRNGLVVQNVSWEDTARFQGSALGPNISDMTLEVDGKRMPVMRTPNFDDQTWDVPIDKIELSCGNEAKGEPLHKVPLRDYLSHFRMYLSDSETWVGYNNTLLADRDSHVLMSAQSCFLPVMAGEESKFNVCLHNYSSKRGDPAVLTIVATAAGTSAQVVESGTEKLYFNKGGERASFVSQRLRDNRRERGVALEGEMTQEEKASNVVMVIQVPLKQSARTCAPLPSAMACGPLPPVHVGIPAVVNRSSVGVDHAIVKVGESDGRKFKEVNGLAIERDDRYPIRVTLQFYKATDTGTLDGEVAEEVATQIARAKSHGDFFGSLVNKHPSESYDRPTEPVIATDALPPEPLEYPLPVQHDPSYRFGNGVPPPAPPVQEEPFLPSFGGGLI